MSYPMKHPPMERKPDGSLYRMTPKQHREAVRIINERCCNCDDGNCLLLDDGDEVVCPQILSASVCCTYFRHVLLKEPEARKLEAEIYRKDDLRLCARCGKPFAATAVDPNTAPTVRASSSGNRRRNTPDAAGRRVEKQERKT